MTMEMQRVALDTQTTALLRGRLSADRRAVTTVIESAKAAQATRADDASWQHEQRALLAGARHHLDQVNAALAKLADGVYGECELCGHDLPLARLEAMPFAAHCARCAEVAGP
jgi:DnaK suppressor protein